MIVIYRDTQNILIATNESTLILFVKQVLSLRLKENIDSYMYFLVQLFSYIEFVEYKYSDKVLQIQILSDLLRELTVGILGFGQPV